jgi:hypothetical protein
VVTAALDRLTRRMLSASSSLSDGTLAAVRNSLNKLRSRLEGDPEWVERVFADRRSRE